MTDQTFPIQTDSIDDLVTSSRLGRRRFLAAVGATVGAGALTAALPVGVARATVPGGASKFVPLPKAVRVVDTREALGPDVTRISQQHIRVKITGGSSGVPTTASAIVSTVTAVNWSEQNWVTVFPSGAEVPLVSTLNMSPGDVTANLSTVRVTSEGSIDLYSLRPCDVIVDVIGYYEQVSGAVREGRFVGLPVAARAIDTRVDLVGADPVTVVELTPWVPAEASSAVVNLTVTETTGPGHFTVFPYTESVPPVASSLNVSRPGATRAAAVIVPVSNVGGRRYLKVFSYAPAKLIVDVTGYFTGVSSSLSQNGLFVPVDPVRILDTRDPGQIGRLWPNWVVEGTVPGVGATQASAIIVNLTGADSRGPGFLTVGPARAPFPVPLTSNLNFTGPSQVVPNHAITPITAAHGFQVLSSHGANVIVDYAGYFTGSPALPQVAKYDNPPPPPVGPPWLVGIPAIGVERWAHDGDANAVTDSGSFWHWTGTGEMGQDAHVAIFGHRTEHGGPLRYLHLLQGGDLVYVTTADRRQFTYQVVRRDLTNNQTANILGATRFQPGTTLSMIACSRPDFTPTSLSYRIVVTCQLLSWTDLG